MKRRSVAACIALSIVVPSFTVVALVGRSSGEPIPTGASPTTSVQASYGPVPSAAVSAGGIDLAMVPDYVSVLGPDATTVIGYVRKTDLFADPKPPSSPAVAVQQTGSHSAMPLYNSSGNQIGVWRGS
jgi:hypothetical protein